MGLTGALAGLATSGEADEPSSKSRKVSVAGNKSAFAMFQAIDQKPPEKSAKEQVKKAKFDAKKDKFESGAAFQKTAKTASAVAGVKGKLSAFENKAKEAEAAVPTRTTTWKVGAGQGQYKAKTKIGGGPAPKKGFADLP